MTATPARSDVTFTHNDEKYGLYLDVNALIDVEEELGQKFGIIAIELTAGQVGIKDLRTIFKHGLRSWDLTNNTERKVWEDRPTGQLMSDYGTKKSIALLGSAIQAAVGDDDEAKEGEGAEGKQ